MTEHVHDFQTEPKSGIRICADPTCRKVERKSDMTTPDPIHPASGDLLPCPFCGDRKSVTDIFTRDGRKIVCRCGASQIAFQPNASEKARAAWNTRPAPPATAAGVGEAVAFGEGRLVVDTGTYHDKPAVFIAPVPVAGEVGSSAKHLKHDAYSLQPGETVLTFPTPDRAKAVADTLVGAPASHDALLPRAREVLGRARRYVIGETGETRLLQEDFDALLADLDAGAGR